MAKTTIVVRTFNRLEYTIICLRSIIATAGTKDYEIYVIDQGSTDGTIEWLKSLLVESYYPLRVRFNKSNSGDAGGMQDAFGSLPDDCKYVMQLDNDLELKNDGWLRILVKMMDDYYDVGAINLKRGKIKNRHITVRNFFQFEGHTFGDAPGTCAAFLLRRGLVEKLQIWRRHENISWGELLGRGILHSGSRVLKSTTLFAEHIDGWEEGYESWYGLQPIKYSVYFSHRNDVKTNWNTTDYKKLYEKLLSELLEKVKI